MSLDTANDYARIIILYFWLLAICLYPLEQRKPDDDQDDDETADHGDFDQRTQSYAIMGDLRRDEQWEIKKEDMVMYLFVSKTVFHTIYPDHSFPSSTSNSH